MSDLAIETALTPRRPWHARGRKKRHLGVDRSAVIVTQALTEATVDDAAAGIDLIRAAAGDVASVTGEGAYDTVAFYKAASARDGAITTWRRSGGAMDEGSGPSEVATALALTH